MHKNASFHQMITAENGNFVLSPLDGSILEKINCRQNSCNVELNTLFNKIALKELAILENFKTLSKIVKEQLTLMFKLKPQMWSSQLLTYSPQFQIQVKENTEI